MSEKRRSRRPPEEEPHGADALPPALKELIENTGSVAVIPDDAAGSAADFDSALRSGPGTGSVDVEPEPEPEVRWAPEPEILPRSAGWALTFAVLGLVMSFLVGWGFPIGITGVILAILALRRPWERRALAVWALVLSLLSIVYSAGWLAWAYSQGAFDAFFSGS